MKPYFSFLKSWTVLAMAVVALFSCKEPNSGYLQSIPADADIVVTLNLPRLIEKGDIAALLKNPDIEKALQRKLDRFTPESRALMEQILHNPQQTGLSVKDDIALFFNIKENEMGVTLKIENRKEFEAALSLFIPEGSGRKIARNRNGYYLSSDDTDMVCVFNDDKALLFSNPYSTGNVNKAFSLLHQQSDQSLLSNDGFGRFLQAGKDVNIWIPMSAYTRQNPVYAALFPEGLNTDNVYITHHIDFQPGKIVDHIENLCSDAETEQSLEHFLSFKGSAANDLLGYFPANSWAIGSISLNGERLYDILSENPYFALMSSNVSGEIDLQGLIGSVDGSLTVGMTGLSANATFGYLPHLTLLASVKDESLLDFLKQNLRLLNVSTLADNQYKVNWNGTDIYFGLKDKHLLYISTDTKVPREAAVPFSETPAAKVFRSGNALVVRIEPVRQHLPSIFPEEEYARIEPWLSALSSIETQSENLSGTLTIYMNNTSENALSTIVKTLQTQIQP